MNFHGWNVTRSTSFANNASSVNGSVAAPMRRYFAYTTPPSTRSASGVANAARASATAPPLTIRNRNDDETMRTREARPSCS